jgi:hypothetical protein
LALTIQVSTILLLQQIEKASRSQLFDCWAEYDACYLQLIFADAVESEIFVVDRIEGTAKDTSLDLVLFVRKQLQLDIRITGSDVGIASRQSDALDHGDVEDAALRVVTVVKQENSQGKDNPLGSFNQPWNMPSCN